MGERKTCAHCKQPFRPLAKGLNEFCQEKRCQADRREKGGVNVPWFAKGGGNG